MCGCAFGKSEKGTEEKIEREKKKALETSKKLTRFSTNSKT